MLIRRLKKDGEIDKLIFGLTITLFPWNSKQPTNI